MFISVRSARKVCSKLHGDGEYPPPPAISTRINLELHVDARESMWDIFCLMLADSEFSAYNFPTPSLVKLTSHLYNFAPLLLSHNKIKLLNNNFNPCYHQSYQVRYLYLFYLVLSICHWLLFAFVLVFLFVLELCLYYVSQTIQ